MSIEIVSIVCKGVISAHARCDGCYWTKQRATNDGVSTQIFCYVKSAPIMFAWKGLMFSVVLEDVSSWCSGGLSR